MKIHHSFTIISAITALSLSSPSLSQITPGTIRIAAPDRIGRINGVAVDSKGRIIVSDGHDNRVSIYNTSMERVATSIGDGTPQGVFHFPGHPLVMKTNSGGILVPDRFGARLLKFSSEGNLEKIYGEDVIGRLDQPMQVAEDQSGYLWVADMNQHGLRILRGDGAYLGPIGSGPGKGDGQFRYVGGVAALQSGYIVASDILNNRLSVWTLNGGFVRNIDVSAAGANAPHPGIIHVADDGTLWVVSGQDRKVVHLNEAGNRLGEISYPSLTGTSTPDPVSIATVGSEVLVADATLNQVLRFDTSGTYLGNLLKKTGDTGRIDLPHAAAMAGNGEVWVADSGNHRLSVYSSNREILRTVGGFGDGNGQFQFPTSVAIGPNGLVAVTDSANHRVQILQQDGTFVRAFGKTLNGNPDLNFPSQAIWAADGSIWVVDTSNSCVKHYAADGAFISKIGSTGSGQGELLGPESMAIAPNGDIYVMDTGNHRIQRFASDGTYLATIGSVGSGQGQFVFPSGLLIDSQGLITVSDRYNHRVQVLRLDGAFVLEYGTFGDATGQFFSPELLMAGPENSILFADSANHLVGQLQVDIDATAPGSTISFSPAVGDGWSMSDVSATITASDGGAGVKEIRYSVNGGTEQVATGTSFAFVLSENGVANISYYAVDNKGNVETAKSATVRIDKIKPSTVASVTVGNVSLLAADQHSGVASTWYSVDGLVAQAYSMPFAANGYYVEFWSVDTAGNVESKQRIDLKASVASVTVSPKALIGGANATGIVELTVPAGPQGTIVALTSSSTRALIVPKNVLLPAGETRATFPIQTNVVAATSNVTVVAKTGIIEKSAVVLVAKPNPALALITLGKSSVMSGRGTSVAVQLAGAATLGGAVVQLQSSHPSVVSVPAAVSIAQGVSRAAFMVTANAVSEPTVVTLTATMNGVSKSVELLVNPVRVVASVSLEPSTVKGGETSVGTVTLNGVTAEPVVVVLSSSNITVAKVFTSVKVPAGASSVTFPVSTLRQSSNKTSVITAKTGGVQSSATISVTK